MWRLYTKELADSIVTCCDTILFLGCNDESSASFVSARSGIASVIVKSTREQKGVGLRFSKALLGYQENAGVGRREVLTPSEARTLGPNECIIIINGLNIMKAYKYPYTLHPLARNGLKSVRLSDFTPATQKYALREDLDAFVMQDLENHWKLQRAKKGKPAPASETEPLPFNTVPKKRKGSRTNSKHDENQLGMFDLNDVGQTTQAEPIPSEPMDMALDGMTLLEVNLPEGYEM